MPLHAKNIWCQMAPFGVPNPCPKNDTPKGANWHPYVGVPTRHPHVKVPQGHPHIRVPSWHPNARVPRGTLRLGTLGTLIRRCQMAPFEVTFLDRNLAPQMVLSGIIYYCVLQVIYLLTRNHLGS